jgi:hypothetical protein
VRVPAGFLYLTVSAYGLYWAHHMITRRHTTSTVAYWYWDLLLGAIILGIGAILRWTRWQARTSWLPVLGSAMVAGYYLGATVATLHRQSVGRIKATIPELGFALIPVLLVLLLLLLALFEKLHPELVEPPHFFDRVSN